VHPVDAPQVSGLAATRGAHNGDDVIPGDIYIDILYDMIAAKRRVEVPAL